MTTSAPTWTLIGLLAAALFALITVTLTSMNRQFDNVNRRLDDLRGEMNGKFDVVDTRFDRLDKDVQALTNHVFRDR